MKRTAAQQVESTVTARWIIQTTAVLLMGPAHGGTPPTDFSADQLSVASFWQEMGPTLRDKGIEAYARRYHEDFRHWDIQGTGRMSDKASAVRAWTRFHQAGHRITCTHVEPITIDIVGDKAFARLLYEETITFADGRVSRDLYRMVDVFQRSAGTWQVLESNMVDLAAGADTKVDDAYRFQCPDA